MPSVKTIGDVSSDVERRCKGVAGFWTFGVVAWASPSWSGLGFLSLWFLCLSDVFDVRGIVNEGVLILCRVVVVVLSLRDAFG